MIPVSKKSEVQQQHYDGNEDLKEICTIGTEDVLSTGIRRPKEEIQIGSLLERIAIDITGPFPETGIENQYIIVATDYFFK